MNINVSSLLYPEKPVDAFIIPLPENPLPLSGFAKLFDNATSNSISNFLELGDFQGKFLETAVIYLPDSHFSKRIILVGLGKQSEIDLEKIRGVFAKGVNLARDLKARNVGTEIDEELCKLSRAEALVALVEGVCLGFYSFNRFKTTDKDKTHEIEELTVYSGTKSFLDELRALVRKTEIVCEATNFARDLVSMPANFMKPRDLADVAIDLAKSRKEVEVEILEKDEIEKLGMNAFLGVAKGSHEPPKLIVVKYRGVGEDKDPIVLIGKGLTFDSGGLSLKSAEKMEEMKSDMAGAAAVLGTIRALSDLSFPVNVVGLIAATENLPGGGALKPGDILKSLSGKTIEVINTDAEGRLTLADAIAFAHRFKPQAIIDIATLTGACVVALGEDLTGMFGNDERLKSRIKMAGEKTGEFVWELPLWNAYEELIKSEVADVKNTGGRQAGAITAALFLKHFVGDVPWVHLDIAGTAWRSKGKSYISKGASGVGVRLLVELITEWQRKAADGT
ncbi:MAG: leucyl aminopeptidase [Syntrophales bacterium]|nr:leucyl aminopeptidase [Syntrophales bacterium]